MSLVIFSVGFGPEIYVMSACEDIKLRN